MKTHATFPESKYIVRIFNEVMKVVEKNITKSSSEYDSKKYEV